MLPSLRDDLRVDHRQVQDDGTNSWNTWARDTSSNYRFPAGWLTVLGYQDSDTGAATTAVVEFGSVIPDMKQYHPRHWP